MSDDTFNYTNSLNIVVAFLIITIGIFGVICNSLMIYVFIKEKSEKTAFNLICFFRAISNVIILTIVFIINFFPKTLLGFSLYPPVLESWLINIANTLYLGNEYQIVLIALNRFCALFFPMHYSRIFTVPKTAAVLILIYIYRLFIKTVQLIPEHEHGCYALFHTDVLTWYYDSWEQCGFNGDALKVVLYTFIAMSVVNLISFAKIITFYRLASWSTHRVWTYFSGTFIWECLHSIDGFIMVMFNEKLSIWKKRIITNNSLASITLQSKRRGTVSTLASPLSTK